MKPVYYTQINPDTTTETEIFRKAHALGYELVKFAGWTDADLGPSGNPGPRRAEANKNARRIAEIVDAVGDYSEIVQVNLAPAPEPKRAYWSKKLQTFVMG